MKTKRLSALLLSLIAILSLCLGSACAESAALDYTAPFVGTWECNFADYPAYVEAGYTGVVSVEFRADGTASTYYNGELDDSYGYFTYLDYYVAILETGETQISRFQLSEDDSVLEYTDLDGNWLITYHKVG